MRAILSAVGFILSAISYSNWRPSNARRSSGILAKVKVQATWGAVLASIPAVSTRIVAFDTAAGALTEGLER
jgi:hypothetical protein